MKVIDIAREAGTSPATFYQYFADVEAAILVLAEEMAQQGQHLTEIITDGSWAGADAFATSLELVDAFLEFWDEHRPVLRVMDLATDEGDGRFQKIRVRLLNDITKALADVTRAVAGGRRRPEGPRPDGGGRHRSCRCSPTRRPTSTASSSGASAPPSSARRWPARSPGASPASRPSADADQARAAAAVPARRGQRSRVDGRVRAATPTRSGFESLLAVEHVAVPVGYASRYPYSDTGRMPLPDDCELPDPLDLLAWLAARTERIRLGTGILVLPEHHPSSSPSGCATIDRLSGGRLFLGVGVGWMREEVEALGIDPDERGTRTDEAIDALRVIWQRGRADVRRASTSAFGPVRSHPKPDPADHPDPRRWPQPRPPPDGPASEATASSRSA